MNATLEIKCTISHAEGLTIQPEDVAESLKKRLNITTLSVRAEEVIHPVTVWLSNIEIESVE